MTKTLLVIVSVFTLPLTLFGQFGANKCDVKLERLAPPQVRIQGPIRVAVKPTRDAAMASQIQSQLEASIIRYEPGLTVSAASPQTELEAEISEFTENRVWEDRKVPNFQKTGTKQVFNAKKNIYESQDVWGTVEVNKRYLVVKGSLKLTWKALAATKQVLASDVASHEVQSSYLEGKDLLGKEAPDAGAVRAALAAGVVQATARRVVPYPETIEVLVARGPGGKLDPGCKLAESGQWTRALESWETIPAFKNPKDEAYRAYDIGLAHEAMAYSAGASRDFQSALTYLGKAAENYGQAADQNPGEKYFRDPQNRIKTSLNYYTSLKDQGSAGVPSVGGAPAGGNAAASAPAASALTNEGVIDFVRSGFSEAFVLDQIRTSPTPRFSVTPSDLVKLKQAGVSERIIMEMIQRK